MIAGRHVVLGVTGGVAAYKAAYLARRLTERGAEVRVVLTDTATEFVGEATFAAITGSHPVRGLFGDPDVSPHTTLARWADAIVIAPATASTMSRLATGQSSDVLVATVLAAQVPVVIAPAMHTEMWEHPATVRNLETLRGDGYVIVDPEQGELAGGDVGTGRLAEPETIVAALERALVDSGADDMAGLSVLVTAGGTREPIDPVRYLGNRSSGKMGTALALDAASRGAQVTLVTTAPAPDHPHIRVREVATAAEMAEAVWAEIADHDVVVMAAAVADFRPKVSHDAKLRRAQGPPEIVLEPTPDILAGVVERATGTTVVGFAAETGGFADIAEKAAGKHVDLLVANDVSRPGSGFGSDTNEVRLVFRDGTTRDLPLAPKDRIAAAIWDEVLGLRA